MNSVSIRKAHDSGFYSKHSAAMKRSSIVEEKQIS